MTINPPSGGRPAAVRPALALIECHARLWTPDASASQAEATAETEAASHTITP